MRIEVGGGRVLDVIVHGDSGPALLFHHGTPSCASGYPPWVARAAEAGLRWISFSRPGYGGSSRRAGRSVADNCTDVSALLDALEVDRFVSVGWSGGGPHALACGALLAPQCAGVVTLAGVAPLDAFIAADLDWYDGMAQENHDEFGAACTGEDALRSYLAPFGADLSGVTGDQIAASLGGLVDAPDVAALTGGFADDVAASFRESVRAGIDGWVDDDLALCRSWGFTLADVQVPVAVWQGEDDRMVPYAHGPFQVERLPASRPHLLAGEGHLSVVVGRFDEIVTEARSFVA